MHTLLQLPALLLTLASPAMRPPAWFALGHRLVADIATARVTPRTAAALHRLLGGQTLADASIWADQIKTRRRDTAPLHYVNIPLEAIGYDPLRDCPRGRCIIAAIDSFARVLADPRAPVPARAEAARFVIHLVGDLHQPLHVADDHDRGGNQTQVRLGAAGTNLHKAWDGQMMETVGASESESLERLEREMATLDLESYARGSVVDWAMEGHEIARERAYRLPRNRQLAGDYVAASLPLIDLALIKAGVRLAALLDRALAT